MSWLDNATESHTTQRSAAWHEWRAKHIGASEIAAVLGESEYQSAFDLWLVKTGQKEPFKGNFATKRGADAEPEIRRLYEELYNVKLTAPVLEYQPWPVLSASLDGFSEEMNLVVEFKYPGKSKHEQAEAGIVPETYRAQLQVQLMVSGADKAHYVSYNGSSIAVVVVEPDIRYQARILAAAQEFWEHVVNRTPPKGGPVTLESETLAALAAEFRRLSMIEKKTGEKLKMVRDRIAELVDEDSAVFHGLSFTRGFRQGSVDYKRVPELRGVDLEPYRKPQVQVVTIKVKGGEDGGD